MTRRLQPQAPTARLSPARLTCTLGVLAASVLLAGCFISAQPKFPLSTAAPALGDGGRYVMYERNGKTFERKDIMEVRRRTDGAYDFVSAEGETTTASLHEIGPNRYVGQAATDDASRTEYAVVEVRGRQVLGFAVPCDKQNQTALKALGVVIGKYSCAIDKVADPMAMFRDLDLGEPTSKLVRQ